MRRAALALTMLILLAPLAAAQGDGFVAFWKEFSAAAAKKDKDKIRALTQYPSPEFEQKSFDVVWKDIFPPRMLACLAKAKPERDDTTKDYVAFCRDTLYGFQRTPQGWRFAYTHPND
ncbi:MAG: hypothetical protein WDO17_22140 [Alphaproteobacteria bacterium]